MGERLIRAIEAQAAGQPIEPAWSRGEWATQAEITWRHGRGPARRRVTYSVIHVPTDRRVESFLDRSDARALVRWLASDVPHIELDGEQVVASEARARLIEIMTLVRDARHMRARIADVMGGDHA